MDGHVDCGHKDCEAMYKASVWLMDKAYDGEIPGLEEMKEGTIEDMIKGYDTVTSEDIKKDIDDETITTIAIARLTKHVTEALAMSVAQDLIGSIVQKETMRQFANPN